MLTSKYSGKVEGLCGDYDGNYLNDFSALSVGKLANTPNEFARLWKTSPSCPDPELPDDFNPCVVRLGALNEGHLRALDEGRFELNPCGRKDCLLR